MSTKCIIKGLLALGMVFTLGCHSSKQGSAPFGGEMPPDPGEAGRSTLEGIDSNENGVRDDLERIAHKRYPDDSVKRAVFMNYMKAAQGVLLAAEYGKYSDIDEASKVETKAMQCLFDKIDGIEAGENVKILELFLVDTDAREKAFTKMEKWYSGQAMPAGDYENPCEGVL
ncbi:MAG: hypothetical protein IPJ88_06345 [Myxococcales bacterium]|nr:MAG: hypothetical protein IPJ88_06345 [Myxococcales bacterium]